MPYAWFFHVFLASTSDVIGRDPLILMATVNVWTAALLPLGLLTPGRSVLQIPSAPFGRARSDAGQSGGAGGRRFGETAGWVAAF
jgi:hypothetical protein